MSPSTNIRSSLTTSTEAKTNSPLNSPYVKKPQFSTKIKYLLVNFDDKFEGSLKETISDQDAKFDENFDAKF